MHFSVETFRKTLKQKNIRGYKMISAGIIFYYAGLFLVNSTDQDTFERVGGVTKNNAIYNYMFTISQIKILYLHNS